ncbi:MAG: aspartate--tRNA(Asn) ligase [Candidatus Nezhaarchaeota archaeon]|nr:aspartate--tRNA(Asn) ligase [Candidatus Nezhaarchaeota archaeon]MCX8141545.1 aspartate--tRNA(Asn) ligase [Candidatus Nezhaarchaeota archaeon]MDW8049812.1 aspartate--tRNA(Asn) ligase [Nitrososphaerota archaeon]
MKLHNLQWKTHRVKDVFKSPEGSKVKIAGWAHAIRDLGSIIFVMFRDVDGMVQVVASKSELDEETFSKLKEIKPESVLSIEGIVRRSPKAPGGLEIKATSVTVLNKASVPSHLEPASRSKLTLDERLDNRVLDLRKPRNIAIFKFQSTLVNSMKEYLNSQGFIEIFTPRLIATATEGGAALFPIAYFDMEAFLAQSPQLYKEQLSSVFERVYEIGPLFRAEESQTDRHVSEYIGVDVEVAFATHREVMELLEDLLVYSVHKTVDELRDELEKNGLSCLEIEKPFTRVTYDEVVKLLVEQGVKIEWGEDLSTEAERKLGEMFKGPYFITDWPTRIKPFYIMPSPDNPEISHSFDLMIGRIEVASGGQRIHNKNLLITRLRESGLEPESFKHHLKCFEWGFPPHAGWGLGLARLVMALLGLSDVREAILYPRDRWRLIP